MRARGSTNLARRFDNQIRAPGLERTQSGRLPPSVPAQLWFHLPANSHLCMLLAERVDATRVVIELHPRTPFYQWSAVLSTMML